MFSLFIYPIPSLTLPLKGREYIVDPTLSRLGLSILGDRIERG